MCVKSFEECYCKCHTDPNIRHIRACCEKCEKCGKNIQDVFLDSHKCSPIPPADYHGGEER